MINGDYPDSNAHALFLGPWPGLQGLAQMGRRRRPRGPEDRQWQRLGPGPVAQQGRTRGEDPKHGHILRSGATCTGEPEILRSGAPCTGEPEILRSGATCTGLDEILGLD